MMALYQATPSSSSRSWLTRYRRSLADQVHDGEESLAVMKILEKVIFGHQSNLITNFGDGIRSVAE